MSSVTDLIGRQRELGRFETLLSQLQPALLVVTGERGCGKSSLLRAWRGLALERGWKVAPLIDNWPLSVSAETGEVDFANQVLEDLGISPGEGFLAASPRADATNFIQTERPTSLSLVEQVATLAPVLLVIDGYQPNPRFKRWFMEVVLRDLHRQTRPVILVVADATKAVDELVHHASEVFTLSRLKTKEIRERFKLIDAQLHLGMPEAELEHYVKAVRENPERFGSLARLVQLGQESTPPDAGSPALEVQEDAQGYRS